MIGLLLGGVSRTAVIAFLFPFLGVAYRRFGFFLPANYVKKRLFSK
jgi:hypothetical protein